jgi:hypothetical protein
MFGNKRRVKERLEKLAAHVEAARHLDAPGEAAAPVTRQHIALNRELSALLDEVLMDDPVGREPAENALVETAVGVNAALEKRVTAAAHGAAADAQAAAARRVGAELEPCRCGNGDLLVRTNATIDFAGADNVAHALLDVWVIVCTACSEVRFRTPESTAALQRTGKYQRVAAARHLRNGGGPFR